MFLLFLKFSNWVSYSSIKLFSLFIRSCNNFIFLIFSSSFKAVLGNFSSLYVVSPESNFDFSSFNPSTDSPRICLFSGRDSSFVGFVGRIYYFKATYNNQLVLDLVPVRKGNVGMMYDKVTGAVYKNTSTGTFIVGPDI